MDSEQIKHWYAMHRKWTPEQVDQLSYDWALEHIVYSSEIAKGQAV